LRARVWAPRAQRVELERAGGRVALRAAGGGWWEGGALAHGEDYAFRLDGEGPFPDPRSPWQPGGVHGRSRHVQHARFRWRDRGWRPPPLRDAVVYEMHVGTFSPEGTFEGAIGRLDHLRALGVTHVELMPVAEFPGARGWGYDGVDLYAPHHAYGGPDGLKKLVDACHARGLAVVMDVVYNHLGPDGNYLGRFGPYFTDRYRTPWGEAVNFDGAASDEVRRFFIDNALMWLRDYHCDGLRLDAVHAILDTSARHFLEELAAEVRALSRALRRPLAVIAESDLNDPRLVRDPGRGGYGLDAQWNEDFHHALHAVLTGERSGYYADFGALGALAATLERGFYYDGRASAYRQRRHGADAADVPRERFVGCLQNHDQVGNRAVGDRIGRQLSPEQLRLGAAIVLLGPFVPMLFQGEEWGAATPFLYFTDHGDAQLAQAVRDGRRREFAAFGWDPSSIPDPQARQTFRESRLDWDEPAREPHAGLLDWHRALIALRRRHGALRAGAACAVAHDERARWLRLDRGRFAIVANFAPKAQAVPLPRRGRWRVAAASADGVAVEGGGIRLPGHAAALIAAAPAARRGSASRPPRRAASARRR
jgi:maltooligosyltrehalose trehalohydrolase